MNKMTKELIQKHQDCIQDYVDLIKVSKGKPNYNNVKALIRKHKVSTSLTTDILRANIVKRINLGVYEILVDKIEPIHARKVLEGRRWYTKNIIKENHNFKDKKVNKKNKSFKDTESLKLPNKKRTISILWGLIKINY